MRAIGIVLLLAGGRGETAEFVASAGGSTTTAATGTDAVTGTGTPATTTGTSTTTGGETSSLSSSSSSSSSPSSSSSSSTTDSSRGVCGAGACRVRRCLRVDRAQRKALRRLRSAVPQHARVRRRGVRPQLSDRTSSTAASVRRPDLDQQHCGGCDVACDDGMFCVERQLPEVVSAAATTCGDPVRR